MKKETEVYLKDLAKEILSGVPEEMSLEMARGFYMYLAEQKFHEDFIEKILPFMTIEDGNLPTEDYKWNLQK